MKVAIKNLQNAACILLMLTSVNAQSFVIGPEEFPDEGVPVEDLPNPEIYEMSVYCKVMHRYANTVVTGKFRNAADKAQEAIFEVVLPNSAFISDFVMEVQGLTYKAFVKEKEEAKNIYNEAVINGLSAAHVAASARDSNKFLISVNVEPKKKAIFKLTYEELLQRKKGRYEIVLNINPGQIVPDLDVKVDIEEHLPLDFVRTPSLRSENDFNRSQSDKVTPNSDIIRMSPNAATVKFHPSKIEQGKIGEELGGKKSEGFNGQFIVEYDVQRNGMDGGEVLINNGYFVHFFAPDKLEAMPKHMVFVLDISGSMIGREMKQLTDAMTKILKDLKQDDIFSIIVFATSVKVWDREEFYDLHLNSRSNYGTLNRVLERKTVPRATTATSVNITSAISALKNLSAEGLTNIIGGLEVGLYIAHRERTGSDFHQPLLMFLTDGRPNVGIPFTSIIVQIVSSLNSHQDKIPIYSLSFGDTPDKNFLRDLSSANLGFSRHIYKASDASLQLENFYDEISTPVLKDVNFKYLDDPERCTHLFFCGTEIVNAGLSPPGWNVPSFIVEGKNSSGMLQMKPKITNSSTSLERLWGFLTVRHILEKRDSSVEKSELTKKATNLALKYSFVTPVTSLVVIKPKETVIVSQDYLGSGRDITAPRSELYFHPPSLPVNRLTAARMPMFNMKDMPVPLPQLQQQEWFRAIMNNAYSIHLGNDFKLATNETVVSRRRCPITISDRPGICTLIHECSRAIPFLTDLQSFRRYFCPIEGYAGVCCDRLR